MSRPASCGGSVASAGRVRVLHVDDDPALRDLTADLLERLEDRMTVRSESDPLAVPERLETEAVDCLVSDVRMPGCDGFELCERVREAHPELPVILFTSERGADTADRAVRAGATDCVVKAPGVEQYRVLAGRIGDAVRSRGTHEEKSESGALLGAHSTA